MIVDVLSEEYVLQLLKSCFDKPRIFDLIYSHVRVSFFSKDAEKKLWDSMVKYKRLKDRLPALAILIQEFRRDEKVTDLLADIKETTVESHDDVIDAFDLFVKNMRFLEMYDKIGDEYNRGKREETIQYMINESESLANFTIKQTYHKRVYADFESRNLDRASQSKHQSPKIPFGIHHLDIDTSGGAEPGEIVLITAESGIGKTKYLVHAGITAARTGNAVAHFQLEGTEAQCFNNYDSAWTATLYHLMKTGDVEKEKLAKLRLIIRKFGLHDIFVVAPEKFGGISLVDLRQKMFELNKITKIGAIVLDYFELLQVGDGIKYNPSDERHRQAKLGQGLKEIAMEFNCVIYTATQASDIPKEFKNDPTFVITRNELSEFKGKLRPFDYHLTFNQTFEEKKKGELRIYKDKLREHFGGEYGDVIKIGTNYNYSRFYDKKRSLEFYLEAKMIKESEDEEDDEPKNNKSKVIKAKD